MPAETQEIAYPPHLFKNEGPFERGQLERLGRARVAVAGLGAFGLGAVGLAQLGVGSGPGGWLRLADPDRFESHNANRQALAGQLGRNKTEVVAEHIRGLVPEVDVQLFAEGVTLANLDDFLRDADLVLDIVDYLRPDVKVALHRRARQLGLPVIAGLLVERGCVAYVFDPAGEVTFDDFFCVPADPTTLATWSLPLSRIVVQPGSPAQQRYYFDVVNGRVPIPSNSLSATATHLLLNHLAVSWLLGQAVPCIPEVVVLDPARLGLERFDLGPSVTAQQASPWTALAPRYDDLMGEACSALYARVAADLAGCRRVLEAGCGTGALCALLARAGHEVAGLDTNLAMLAQAAPRARAEGFRVGEGDVENLFFADASFDGYASVNVVLHTCLERTLAEARRVLRPGGTLILSSFTATPPLEVLPPDLQRLARQVHEGRSYPPLAEVLEWVQQAGFEPLVADRGFLEDSYYVVARR